METSCTYYLPTSGLIILTKSISAPWIIFKGNNDSRERRRNMLERHHGLIRERERGRERWMNKREKRQRTKSCEKAKITKNAEIERQDVVDY